MSFELKTIEPDTIYNSYSDFLVRIFELILDKLVNVKIVLNFFYSYTITQITVHNSTSELIILRNTSTSELYVTVLKGKAFSFSNELKKC